MTRYIAFLRAINVSGHGVIKMEELRKIFESQKFKNVQTYIQSGNVIFDTNEKNPDVVESKIQKALEKKFGYEIEAMLRTVPELQAIIKTNPFKKINLDKNINLYVSVLSDKPGNDLQKSFISSSDEIATFKMTDREVYTLYKRKNAKNPFSNSFVEKKLKVASTTRNWSVISKIFEIAAE